MPQDFVSLTWYPVPRVELSGYYFWSTILDPLFLDAFDSEAANNRNTIYTGQGRDEREEFLPKEDFEDYNAFAVRAVWYADMFTAGFTYYNGRNHLAFEELPLLQKPNADTYNIIDRVIMPRTSTFGIELSVPVGRWSWIFEMSYAQTQTSLRGDSTAAGYERQRIQQDRDNLDNDFMGDPDGRAQRELQLTDDTDRLDKKVEYFNWVQNSNDSRFYAPIDNLLIGFGVDAEYDQLVVSLAAYLLVEVFSDELKQGLDLEKAAYPGVYTSDRYTEDIQPFPTGGVAWRFGADREHVVGVVGGLLGPAIGGAVYYNGAWRDNFKWSASFEFFRFVSDNFIADAETNVPCG